MKLIKEIPFDYEGISYSIKVFQTDNGYLVRAFQGDSFANCFVYEVEYSNNYNFLEKFGKEAYEQLIDIARNDITKE